MGKQEENWSTKLVYRKTVLTGRFSSEILNSITGYLRWVIMVTIAKFLMLSSCIHGIYFEIPAN